MLEGRPQVRQAPGEAGPGEAGLRRADPGRGGPLSQCDSTPAPITAL